MQRVRGAAHVDIGRRGLIDLHQAGSAKAMLPRVDGSVPEVVFLNTSGGMTGGDVLRYSLAVGTDTQVTATTQTAERAYRSIGGHSDVAVELRVGSGGHLDWLPQETILFDGAALHRTTRVTLAQGATFLGVDSVVLGRRAMDETVTRLTFEDRRDVTGPNGPIHSEHVALTDDVLTDPKALGLHYAIATMVAIGPDVADRLPGLRAVLPDFAAASAWDGRMVARFVHADPAMLRRAVIRAIVAWRGRPMPRVWQAEAHL